MDIGIGFDIEGRERWQGYSLAFEYSMPVYQHVDGPQLETDAQLVIGLQRTF